MQKLKNTMIGKMIAAGLTSKEIDFLIYVSFFQNSTGKSYGIHYRELCKTMHMSYQEFYNAKVSLEEKGFIRCEKTPVGVGNDEVVCFLVCPLSSEILSQLIIKYLVWLPVYIIWLFRTDNRIQFH